MVKLIVVLGLCGSGKTYLSEKINKKTGAKIFEGVVHHKSLPEIVKCLHNGENCVIEEIAYCTQEGRTQLTTIIEKEVKGVAIEWVCLENDLSSANWNVKKRTNKNNIEGHLNINNHWHSLYTYPVGIKPIPITRI